MSAANTFDWADANRNHLAAHEVQPDEFEQLFQRPRFEVVRQRNNEQRVWCLGRTDSGRLLTAVSPNATAAFAL